MHLSLKRMLRELREVLAAETGSWRLDKANLQESLEHQCSVAEAGEMAHANEIRCA